MKHRIIEPIKFRGYNKTRIKLVSDIFDDFVDNGFQANLRQVHYKLLDSDPNYDNTPENYHKLSKLVTSGRMSGMLDWNVIIDESRASWQYNSWVDSKHFLSDIIDQFRLDRTIGQEYHLEVWTEKFGVSNVLSKITKPYQIPVMNNRGFASTTYTYNAAKRFSRSHKPVKIIYLGDHDPSGLNMIDDLLNRLDTFSLELGFEFEIIPIALTLEQIEKFNVRENFVKINDSRSRSYIERFGNRSWELDAMDLKYLQNITEIEIQKHIDLDILNTIIRDENDQREILKTIEL